MKICRNIRVNTRIIGVCVLAVSCSEVAFSQSRYAKPNHLQTATPYNPVPYQTMTGPSTAYPAQNYGYPQQNYSAHYGQNPAPSYGQNSGNHANSNYGQPPSQPPQVYGRYGTPVTQGGAAQSTSKYSGLMGWIKGQKNLAYQTRAPQPAPSDMFQQWVDYEPQYTFFPGDQIDIVVSSAPELSRTLTVGPDGRITMPMVAPIMAAGHTIMQIRDAVQAQLATQLVDPAIAVTPRAFAPAQVYVGGAVNAPGTYALPGPVGALETIIMAGGMTTGAKTKSVAVLRRAPNGGMMMRAVNISNGLKNIREYNDNIQLRRGDIIFVPRTTLTEVGNFVQSLRRALPVDVNVSYNLGGNGGGTDPAILNDGTTTSISPKF